MLSSKVLYVESVQINVIISQLLLIRVINTQCKQETEHTFFPFLLRLISPFFWNGLEQAQPVGKGLLLATLQSRFSSAHNSLSKGREGGKENP